VKTVRKETAHVEACDKVLFITSVSCDKCGELLGDLDCGNPGASEIVVTMDPDACAFAQHVRDYCTDCSHDIWAALCTVIGADPDDRNVQLTLN
jgi:hypothetical protein